jgi:hypothetical protein
MTSNPERPPKAFPLAVAWASPFFVAVFLTVAFPSVASPAGTFASLSGMARLEAEDHLDANGASSLVRGYLALRLGMEAASSLDRRIRLGEFPRDAAVPFFEKILADRNGWEDAVELVAICDMAAKNGVESP